MSRAGDITARIAGFTNDSITDGPGLRFTIFFQGCPHKCPFCHNPETHDPNGGQTMTIEEIAQLAAQNPLLDGVTISGGEPFLQPDALGALVERLSRELPIIVYTGYLWEDIVTDPALHQILQHLTHVVDGRYIHELRSLALLFRGSANQRIIDVQKSLETGETIITEL